MSYKGYIYEIVCGDETCVGSTAGGLENYLMKLKTDYIKFKNGKIKKELTVYGMFDRNDMSNAKIILLEEFGYNKKSEIDDRVKSHADGKVDDVKIEPEYEFFECCCGSKVRKDSIKSHNKSEKHKWYKMKNDV
jgi:hypothetical protein